jgi:hypothetical protein
MLDQYGIVPFLAQEERVPSQQEWEPSELSHRYAMNFLRFLEPLLRELDVTIDKRPLRTLVQTVEAMVSFRDRSHGLVLSELGGYMDGLGRGEERNGSAPSSTIRGGKPTRSRSFCSSEQTSRLRSGKHEERRGCSSGMAPCWKSRRV